jgi:antitoxin ParD1/3/4
MFQKEPNMMEITLSPEQEQLVREKLASGQYESASQVVGEALRLLQEQDQATQEELEALRAEIRVGLDQLDRGEAKTYEAEPLKELFEQIKSRGRKRLASQRKKGSG